MFCVLLVVVTFRKSNRPVDAGVKLGVAKLGVAKLGVGVEKLSAGI